MLARSALNQTPGLLARTVVEIGLHERAAAFRRQRASRSKLALLRADALMTLVEDCRERDLALVPPNLWSAIIALLTDVDQGLRDHLGIDRHPEHVASVLFTLQAELMRRNRERCVPQLAKIIPLFAATG